jgi:hypothetical protein
MPAAPESRTAEIEARYANHFQVGQNEYEFIFDFGQFHASESGASASPIAPVRIVRIVMAPTFAKALLHTLGRAIQQHESEHGPIEQS